MADGDDIPDLPMADAEQRAAAAEARESGELLALARRASGAGTFDLDITKGLVRYCPRSLEMLGHPPDRSPILTAAEWAEHIFPGDAARVLSEGISARHKGTDFITEYRIVAKDGSIRWVRGLGRTLRGPNGEPVRCIGFNFDITGEKQAAARLRKMQAELLQASKANAATTMGEALAHELNQPLTALTSYLSGARNLLAEMSDEQAASVRRVFGQALEAAQRVAAAVRELRALARPKRGASGSARLDLAIRAALDFAAADAGERGIKVVTALASDLDVRADELEVQQVVYNLVRHAIEAMEGAPRKILHVSVTAKDKDALIRVQDSGPGIAEAERATLFEPFNASRGSTLGISLAVARNIVEANGGRIWVEHPEEGPAFCFALPLSRTIS